MSQASSMNGSLHEPPFLPPDSPGSSVSTRLQDEYDELLRYAVVVPEYNPALIRGTLTDTRGHFTTSADHIAAVISGPSLPSYQRDSFAGYRRRPPEEEGEKTPTGSANGSHIGLPDFGQSPIDPKLPLNRNNHAAKMHSDSSSEEEAPVSRFGSDTSQVSATSERSQSVGSRKGSTVSRASIASGGPASRKGTGVSWGQGRGSVSPGGGSRKGSRVEGTRDVTGRENVYTTTIDPDLGKMADLMDQWGLELKRNVLAEFSESKKIIEQRCREEIHTLTNKETKKNDNLVKELDSLKEYLHNFKDAMARKDTIIGNLTQALARSRDKTLMARNFAIWRSHHQDLRREAFCLAMSKQHYQRSLNRRVLRAWFSLVHAKWRTRLEKACQQRASEVCMQLSADSQTKISELNEQLGAYERQLHVIHAARAKQEGDMKKALMRGVCALNMEAMSLFHDQKDGGGPGEGGYDDDKFAHLGGGAGPNQPQPGQVDVMARPFEPPPPPPPPAPRVVTTLGTRPSSMSAPPVCTTARQGTNVSSNSRPRSAVKAQGRSHRPRSTSPNAPVRGPASIVVERHHPVNKQTIGAATRQQGWDYGENFRRLAGQDGLGVGHGKGNNSPRSPHSNIGMKGDDLKNVFSQGIKVVE